MKKTTKNMAKKDSNTLIVVLSLFLFVVLAVTFYLVTTYRKQAYSLQLKELQSQSDSTEVTDIQKDLNNTNLDSVDSDLQGIEKELNSL